MPCAQLTADVRAAAEGARRGAGPAPALPPVALLVASMMVSCGVAAHTVALGPGAADVSKAVAEVAASIVPWLASRPFMRMVVSNLREGYPFAFVGRLAGRPQPPLGEGLGADALDDGGCRVRVWRPPAPKAPPQPPQPPQPPAAGRGSAAASGEGEGACGACGECPVCLEPLGEEEDGGRRALPCFAQRLAGPVHETCGACWRGMAARARARGESHVPCPLCRLPCPVGGVAL